VSGRRVYHGRRRVNPITFVIMALVIALAVFLVILNLKKDGNVGDNDMLTSDISEPAESATPADLEPQPDPIPVIDVFGEITKYDAVYCVGNTGYEMYTYVDSTAQKYAQCVNKVADDLAGTADVYDIVVPLSSGVTLPDELYGQDIFSDQEKAEDSILGYMNGNVKTVPLYDTLMQHRDEYIYYRTDHHWTGLGAYYAYTQFCRKMGHNPNDETAYEKKDFDGFLGTFYNDTGSSQALGATPDTVTAYYPISGAKMDIFDENGSLVFDDVEVICDESTAPAAYKYGAYIYGDNAYSVITNETITDGSSCVLVKESFGNAFAPFLADHYQTVYVIDYRDWTGSLTDFVKTNGVDDVVFCNNLSAIRNSALIGKLFGIL